MEKNKGKVIRPLNVTKSKYDKLIFGLLFLILAVIPIIIRVKPTINTFPSIDLYPGLDRVLDPASYYKFLWLIIGTVLIVAVFTYKILKEKYEIHLGYAGIPALVLFITILMSGFFTKFKEVGIYGSYGHYEGTLAYLMYLMLFAIAVNIEFTGEKVRWLFNALYPVTLINFIMSLLMFFRYQILDSSLGSLLILPSMISRSDSHGLDDILGGTMGNPDYQSALGAVLTVVFLTRGILAKDKKTKLWSYIFGMLAFIILLTSFASSGFVTLVLLIPMVIVFIFRLKERKQAIRMGLFYLLGFIVVFTALNAIDSQVMKNTIGTFVGSGDNTKTTPYYSRLNAEFNLPQPGFSAGSGRLYIWKNTIPLIEAKPVLGYGMDTLLYVFPQNDPQKVAGLYDPEMDVDKAHNYYLGIAYGSGVLALIAFVVLIAAHAIKHIKIIKKGLNNDRQVNLAILFTTWCAFLIQWVLNDSVIGISVMFWILFGASISIMRQELKE